MSDAAVEPLSATRRPGSGHLRALVRLALDERAARARRTLLGRYWAILLPLMESGVFWLLFSVLLRLRGTSSSYLAFAYVGVFTWRTFSRGVTAAGGAPARNAPLLHSLSLRVSTLLAATVLGVLIDALLGAPLLLAVVVYFEALPGPVDLVVWLPVALALHLATTLGLALLAGVANAFYRDVGLVLAPGLAMAMFAAPVVYPLRVVPPEYRGIYLANPMAAAIESYRAALLGTEPLSAGPLLAAALVALALLAGGWALARALDGRIRELL